MTKEFLKKNAHTLGLVFSSLTIFALVFGLFQMDWAIYWVSAALILCILVLDLVYQAIQFQKKQALEEKINELTETLEEERNTNRLMRQDIEEYFLLWVHQIKTPITASYLLLEDDDFKNKPFLQQEILKIENYVSLALNYLKVQNPANDMDFRYVTVDEIISPLLKKYRVQFIYSKITLHYTKESHKILTEPNLTSLMIEQLLSNALKYTKKGDIWVAFDEKTKQLTIKDNGIGICEEDLPKIFDKGYAGMNGQLETKSSGIGLYLVQLISKRLEQPVHVESELGKGTTFTLQLFDA
ncbi:two-component system, OmpR family, sensor histidine kinase BraS/BceS [Atopostipes suicloacalis DSM 15692]|uniref:histidine kinase n=1 Tax=Atopostipes suicloacalis DSM 15692 TaxID=1121025 RepID=A0A1M4SHK2_9LACT|nr:sensor histidine kinase [Atopostipes suicloacalis]SHE31681.1 two-component system, OmpR family, sensor histidine kinase BraS/BceS [Atopostipes suicloacalis DSM 15692]